jgi:hypothetical protein
MTGLLPSLLGSGMPAKYLHEWSANHSTSGSNWSIHAGLKRSGVLVLNGLVRLRGAANGGTRNQPSSPLRELTAIGAHELRRGTSAE